MSLIDIKNLPERDRRLLFGEVIKGTLEWNTRNMASEKPQNGENAENYSDPAIKKKDVPDHFLQRFVISYNSSWKSAWDVYIMFFICFSCITTAY